MFFILSKTLDFFLLPVIWLVALFLLAFFSKKPVRKKRFFLAAFLLFLLLSNPFLINLMFLAWEIQPKKISDIDPHDLGIVLTGITKHDKQPDDRIYFEEGADRIMHAFMLYKAGKVKKILITGATVDIYGNKKISEARRLGELLKSFGIPKKDIILEESARNTRENAVFTKKYLDKHQPGKTCLLITSGFHMRRSLACFRKIGLMPTPFSAGFYSYDLKYVTLKSFVPSEKSFYKSYILIREISGYLVYRLVGYAA